MKPPPTIMKKTTIWTVWGQAGQNGARMQENNQLVVFKFDKKMTVNHYNFITEIKNKNIKKIEYQVNFRGGL